LNFPKLAAVLEPTSASAPEFGRAGRVTRDFAELRGGYCVRNDCAI
jgi:hypothetical protein